VPGETQSDPIADAVAGLADISVGPGLAAALAPLEDLKTLTGSQCLDLLKALYRQNNHDRAQLFAVITEVMRRTEAQTVVPEDVWPVEFAADEVRAALVMTRTAAEGLCALAEDVLRRLPAVQQAFAAGVIDQPRVRVFSVWTCGLSDEHTAAIVAALLPKAHQLTTAQLMHQIQRYAIALDPNWARKRYEQALKGRRVVGSRNSDGTANLAGYDLPPDQVAAAAARLDRLAKAAKQAGHPDPIDHVRSYLFLGMTDGSFEGLTDPQILARLLADANLTQPAPTTEPAQGDPADEPTADEPTADEATADDDSVDQPANERSADESSTEDKADDYLPAESPSAAGEGGPAGPASGGGDDNGGGPGHDGDGPEQGDGAVGRSSGLRLLVRLATLAGADQRPGDLIGSGPVHAELARAIASAPGASWWYVLKNPNGAPLAVGQVRSRPDDPVPGGRGYPGLQVWLQVTQATLDCLARQTHPPGWGRVISEITAKAGINAGPPNGDTTARLPGAALRRWIQVRDRTCTFPGCRVPAHRADADHSVEHADGGPTIDTNLGPACRHDHRLRHEGGWVLTQTTPGQFTWTSRLGHTYHRQPPPDLDDLPEPMPGSAKDDDESDLPSTEDWRNSTCMEPERHPRPAPAPPPPVTSPEDDIPPF
jgi:Domain of unknown function (DUF222)